MWKLTRRRTASYSENEHYYKQQTRDVDQSFIIFITINLPSIGLEFVYLILDAYPHTPCGRSNVIEMPVLNEAAPYM